MSAPDKKPSKDNEFARQAGMKRGSTLGEYLFLLKTNRKWWMLPLVLLLLGLGALMVLSSTGVAPFIYTVF